MRTSLQFFGGAYALALGAVLQLGLQVACAAPDAPQSAEPAAQPADEKAPSEQAPMMRESADTDPEALGTLPEGVGLAVGSSAPELVGTDHEGHSVELKSLWESGDVLLVFYRGGWCPYCNSQIHELTTAYPQFEERGITPVAVSVDRVEEAARTQNAHAIPFPVLSDPDLTWHEAFHVLNELSDEDVARLAGYDIDIEAHSGKTHHTIAVPSIFLIDTNGKIRWAHAAHDYKVRPRTASLLAALDGLSPAS